MWTDYLPVASIGAKPELVSYPLDLTNTKDYLRAFTIDEPKIFAGGVSVFALAKARTYTPYVDGVQLASTTYSYTDNSIVLNSPLPSSKRLVAYPTALAFFFRDSVALSKSVRYDIFGNKTKNFKNSIKSACPDYSLFQCTVRHEYAPDRIAKDALGDEELYWCIMQYNGLIFPEQIEAGSIVKVPDRVQLKTWLTSMTAKNVFTSTSSKVRI